MPPRLTHAQTPLYSSAAVREGYSQLADLAKLLASRRFPQFWSKVRCRNVPCTPSMI
jgi:hypothetical protein